jgi:hypothetical protein
LNGTVIDISGIKVDVVPIELQDSTDKSYIINIADESVGVTIIVTFGKITSIEKWSV